MTMSWMNFVQQAPELATFGAERFKRSAGYLGTICKDGSPRVHPVTPILGKHLFLFMEPTSPKGKDLQRDPRYTLHCGVGDSSGGEGEFYVRGCAQLVQDSELRAQAVEAAPYHPAEHYILFVLSVECAVLNTYTNGKPNPRRWHPSA
ncbi:MAG: pyridoxamine 5*-phosphate oxidase [Chloroflexi bacterium AL-W]|nr:pyridoxamine 5*-phosphate oxidase [Chloroflexi bacterium AL-N1]NOK67995.1 pyridoxamine 5*-phosphate oxidase [Chloroflexi bacterium AL-N10]NOK73335.1 pyridoxamine 5*-phosphate oxidase [Chloroflexi bacterium AL-N5]NOK83249.1 pyridoxamine 5*-phosphate oxidase [Chloroflexi bacterium AL-W]NOK87666.1 pyridoxamine 5*-phosphate oxidase [Chloroflexi bacterium AL-N15]